MLLTAIALTLSIAGIAAFPCWRYSARWGFAPSTIAGALLFFVSLLIVGGKVASTEALAHRFAAQPQQQQAMMATSMMEKAASEKPRAEAAVAIAGPPVPLRRSVVAMETGPYPK